MTPSRDLGSLSLVQRIVHNATNVGMCVRFMQERPYVSFHPTQGVYESGWNHHSISKVQGYQPGGT